MAERRYQRIAPGDDREVIKHGEGEQQQKLHPAVKRRPEQQQPSREEHQRPAQQAHPDQSRPGGGENLQHQRPEGEVPFVAHLVENSRNVQLPGDEPCLQFVAPRLMMPHAAQRESGVSHPQEREPRRAVAGEEAGIACACPSEETFQLRGLFHDEDVISVYRPTLCALLRPWG